MTDTLEALWVYGVPPEVNQSPGYKGTPACPGALLESLCGWWGSRLGGGHPAAGGDGNLVREDPDSPPTAHPGPNCSPFRTYPAAQHTAPHHGAHPSLYPSFPSSTSPASWTQRGRCPPLCQCLTPSQPPAPCLHCASLLTPKSIPAKNPIQSYQVKGTLLHPLARCSDLLQWQQPPRHRHSLPFTPAASGIPSPLSLPHSSQAKTSPPLRSPWCH